VQRNGSVLISNLSRRTKPHNGAILGVDRRFGGLRDGSFPEMILDLLPHAA
jgi:hypothetical protein